MLGKDPVEPRPGIVVRKQALHYRDVIRAECKFRRVAGAKDGPGEDRQRDGYAQFSHGLSDARGLRTAVLRNIALPLAVADAEGPVAGHAAGIGVPEEHHEPALAQALDQRGAARILHGDRLFPA